MWSPSTCEFSFLGGRGEGDKASFLKSAFCKTKIWSKWGASADTTSCLFICLCGRRLCKWLVHQLSTMHQAIHHAPSPHRRTPRPRVRPGIPGLPPPPICSINRRVGLARNPRPNSGSRRPAMRCGLWSVDGYVTHMILYILWRGPTGVSNIVACRPNCLLSFTY
jgi:hypothetical protein